MAATTRSVRPVYLALSGSALIDIGNELDSFVRQLCEEWERGGADTAVWLEAREGSPRLVAVLRSGMAGKPLVTWL